MEEKYLCCLKKFRACEYSEIKWIRINFQGGAEHFTSSIK